ncbi:MAG: nucleotidyltransferase domain-containing protein [Clostridiales bacterium]|nr:nucleotidyltransferase domain-containing protein [Clostridiales bacterium]
MPENIKIHKENYENLPCRFVQKIEYDLAYLLKADIPNLKKIYLFGSCARGEVRSSSDIDLLIVTEKKLENRMLAADIRWTLDIPINNVRTDIVYWNEQAERENTVFETVVNRDKKILLEVIHD